MDTLSLDEAKAKHDELVLAASRAGFNQTNPAPETAEKPSAPVVSNTAEGVILKIHANQSQINQICDFMKAIGVAYEIQQVTERV